jgi:hypothetical protein
VAQKLHGFVTRVTKVVTSGTETAWFCNQSNKGHLPTSRGFSGHFNISIGHPSSYKLLKVSINTGYFDSIYRDLDTRSLSCKKRKTNENKRIQHL